MKTPRFLHYLILLLAVWFPLDNAVAGAVIADCPIMSHAFEKGVHVTIDPSAAAHTVASPMIGLVSLHLQSSTSNHPDGCCDHCGACLLLGGAALPSLYAAPAPILHPAAYHTGARAQAPTGIQAQPFRPPIV